MTARIVSTTQHEHHYETLVEIMNRVQDDRSFRQWIVRETGIDRPLMVLREPTPKIVLVHTVCSAPEELLVRVTEEVVDGETRARKIELKVHPFGSAFVLTDNYRYSGYYIELPPDIAERELNGQFTREEEQAILHADGYDAGFSSDHPQQQPALFFDEQNEQNLFARRAIRYLDAMTIRVMGLPPRAFDHSDDGRGANVSGSDCSVVVNRSFVGNPRLEVGVGGEKWIGDADCQYTARSQYLRCAVNPEGPCEGCKYKET